MSQNSSHSAFIVNSLIIFSLSLVTELSFDDLYIFLKAKDYHQNQIEHIEVLKMLGQIIVGFILLQIINLLDLKKLSIIFLTILLISKFSIIFLADYNLVKIHYMIVSGCCFNLFILFLLQLCKCSNKYLSTIIIFLLLITLGRIAGEAIFNNITILRSFNYEILTMLVYIVILITTFSAKPPISVTTLFKTNFINIISNIELELLSAFTAAYVSLAIYWEYEIFAIAENLKIENIIEVKHYLLLGCMVISCPMQFIFKQKKVTDIVLLILLLFGIFSWKYIGDNYNLNLLTVIMIGVALSSIWLNNLISIFKKFTDENLNIAVTCYFSFSAIGSYLGMISTDESINKIGEWGFIYSICFVVGTFLLYYVGQFSKNKY